MRALRERMKLTQEELAKRLGVDRITVVRYEMDRAKISKVLELALKEIERQG